MDTHYVLIDFENVHVKSLALLQGKQFKPRVFLGPSNTKLPVDLVVAMQLLGDRAQYIQLEASGTNALDFHIAYYLGRLALQEPAATFHIISKDKGFDPLIKHLKTQGIQASRSVSIETMPNFRKAAKPTPLPIKTATPTTTTKIDSSLLKVVVKDLERRKAARPASTKTLLNTIHATIGKSHSALMAESIYLKLREQGWVQEKGDKVSYALPNAL